MVNHFDESAQEDGRVVFFLLLFPSVSENVHTLAGYCSDNKLQPAKIRTYNCKHIPPFIIYSCHYILAFLRLEVSC